MDITSINKMELLLETNSATNILSGFLQQQVLDWPLAARNYQGLEKVEEKEFLFDGFKIKVQFNPERIRSSAAKVDKKSIQERACFLCMNNLPDEQTGISFGDDLVIMVNPFPILKQHFTIPKVEHIAQSFIDNLESMLKLVKAMRGYTLFYNGPHSGASAPDHMHFQAGKKDFMPVESEYFALKDYQSDILVKTSDVEVRSFHNYLRKMITIETTSQEKAVRVITDLYNEFADMQSEEIEPMLNVICSYIDGKYIVHLFPRKLHRPRQYFEEGETQLLISPASVDFGGVFVTPRREDFEKITAGDIEDIFRQVSIDEEFFKQLCDSITEKLR